MLFSSDCVDGMVSQIDLSLREVRDVHCRHFAAVLFLAGESDERQPVLGGGGLLCVESGQDLNHREHCGAKCIEGEPFGLVLVVDEYLFKEFHSFGFVAIDALEFAGEPHHFVELHPLGEVHGFVNFLQVVKRFTHRHIGHLPAKVLVVIL